MSLDWRRAEDLFEAASQLPKGEVPAFLERACDDPELRQIVIELLAEGDAKPEEFVRGLIAQEASTASDDRVGQQIGLYRVQSKIGAGGMGEVYLAVRGEEDAEDRVALKVVRGGLAIGGLLGRFRQERQILARLEHPNIVRLLDGGTTPDGLPFLVMDYVEGTPIPAYCDTRKLDTKERCALLLQVCDAVDHAHRHLVVHRDIKPANILVTAAGVPKLLDFGIAKILDTTQAGDQTVTGYRPLTPDYASPEQVSGGPVTTSTDVYQIGAVLYRLLTGRKPANAEQEPLAGDAGIIVRHAMNRDPERRYGSVRQLAEDLRRFVENRPILARGESVPYRLGKWIRRSPWTAAALALAVISAMAGVTATLYQARRAERRFQQVRSLAGAIVFQFDDKIRDLVGSTAARSFVVETAVRYLDSLAPEADGDVSLLSEVAAAHANIGMIQGSPLISNLGRPDDAMQSFDRAISLSRQILARDPRHRASLQCLIQGLTQKGLVLTHSRKDRKAGQALIVEAQSHADRLSVEPGLTPIDFRVIGLAYKSRGEGLSASPKEAIVHLEKAAAVMERALKEGGGEEFRVASVGVLVGLARAQRDLGNTPEWVRRLESAAAVVEAQYRAEPAREGLRRQLWVIRMGLGSAYAGVRVFHMNQPEKAFEVLRRAEELTNAPQLAAFAAALEKALTYSHMAHVLGPNGDERSRAEIAAIEELQRLDPKNATAASLKRNAEFMAALHLLHGGNARAALPVFLNHREKLVQALQANADDLAALDDIVLTDASLGNAYTALGQWESAANYLADGARRAEATLVKHPDDLYFIRGQAWIFEAFGDYHRARGDASNSRKYYAESIGAWERWRRTAPSGSAYPARYIAELQRKIANPNSKEAARDLAVMR